MIFKKIKEKAIVICSKQQEEPMDAIEEITCHSGGLDLLQAASIGGMKNVAAIME